MPWSDRIHGPMAAMYERHLDHVLTYRGVRGKDEKIRITLCLMPRFSFKTTLGVIVFAIWATTIEPNITIVLGSRREDLAVKSLGAIKRILESYGPYIAKFGKRKPESKDTDLRLAWASSGIIVADRTDHRLKERTVEVVGVKSLDPGFHFDMGLWDDPHGDDTPEEIEATWQAMQLYIPISHPWGVMAVTMTVWEDFDVPARMDLEWAKDLSERLFQPAVTEDWKTVLMPELYTLDRLEMYKRTMGVHKATRQFALVRVSTEEQKFPPDLYFEEEYTRSDAQLCIITVDPAFSKWSKTREMSQGSDHAIAVCGWLGGGMCHVYDILAEPWPEEIFLDILTDTIKKWRPNIVAIEKNAVEYWISSNLEKRLRRFEWAKGERRPTIEPVHHEEMSKPSRIAWMIDPYKRRELTFSRLISVRDKFREQLFAYPRGMKMDCLDALAYQFKVIKDRMPSESQSMPRDYLDKLMTLESTRPGWYNAVLKGEPSGYTFSSGEKRSWKSV